MKSKNTSINVITLGCSKNIVDSEILLANLKRNDFIITHDSDNPADIVVINTCGFIQDAKEESIDTIVRYIEAKKENLVKKVYVMGCLSERYKDDLKKEIPEVDGFFGVNEFENIISEFKKTDLTEFKYDRHLTTPGHFAFLKIAEGCDRKCSFCAIPLIRGKHISRPIEEIITEAETIVKKGVKEIIVISQDTTYYGLDLYKKRRLAELLVRLSDIKGLEWIRLQYTYPADFPIDVLDVMANKSNICNYLDVPLQHVSNNLLKSMRRGNSEEETKNFIKTVKEKIPNVAVRTTLIVGYPGETEEDFEKLKSFVSENRFDRLGVFTYSAEEDTYADSLEDNVTENIKQQRADEIMDIQQEISLEINTNKIGKTFKVLIDRVEGEYFVGRTEYDSPEVDNEVLIEKLKSDLTIGEFYNIKIKSSDYFDLFGDLVI